MQSVECVFFDCDDCLYRNSWDTAERLNAKFGEYCETKLGVSSSKMMQLFSAHGTTLCGLVREGHLQEGQVEDFLAKVHDVPLNISPDPELRQMLLSLPRQRWVFTAATREHAERCLDKLGIADLFLGIVACSSPEMISKVGYVSKHDPRCFYAAMDLASVPRERASSCLLLDDSAKNLKTASAVGWRAVLVGRYGRDGSAVVCPEADAMVNSLHEVPKALPCLFQPSAVPQKGKRRRRELKPLDSSPGRRVLRRVSTPQSPGRPSLSGHYADVMGSNVLIA